MPSINSAADNQLNMDYNMLASSMEEEIKDAIKNIFLESPEAAANVVKIVKSKSSMDGQQFQFHCGPIAKAIGLEMSIIVMRIRKSLPSSSRSYKSISVSDGGFVTLYINEQDKKKCSCDLKGSVGEQKIQFSVNGSNLKDNLLQLLIEKMNLTTEQKKDNTIIGKIQKNLRVHMGADIEIKNIMEAVEYVSNRNYPELNTDNFDPIYVPKFFIAKHAEGIDLNIYPEELKGQKESLEKTIDFKKVQELNALQFLKEKIEKATNGNKEKVKREAEKRLKRHKMYRHLDHTLTDQEHQWLETLRKIEALNGKISNVVGERAEKKVYKFLEKCLRDKETVIVNNFKIITLQDLDKLKNGKPAREIEKDFVIFHLKKRSIISLEIKYKYRAKSLNDAIEQAKCCKGMISKWCGCDLTEENGWRFFSVIYFDIKSEDTTFCQECSKYIVIGDELEQKLPRLLKEIPEPPSETIAKAKEEFKNIVQSLLFLASAEPVITPRRITTKVVEMVDKAGAEENILFWNKLLGKMFCWTPLQLSFLKDENLRNVLFLSPPSCGKTVLKKAKVKYFGLQKGEDVVFLLPCIRGKYLEMETIPTQFPK